MIRADLHTHSKYSEHPSEWFLQRLGAQESYVEPEFIYKTAKERGMDLVTITDHNMIEGSIILNGLYPEDTFTGVESTVYFPEDECKVHLLVYGLTERQYSDIQKIRTDIYEMRDFLRQENLAHATYSVNGKISIEHLEKLILLFDVFEGINGGREKIMTQNNLISELQPNIFLIRVEDGSSHSYFIRGDYKNVLIDSGLDSNFPKLQRSLLSMGVKVKDIDIVINTHEHFDHIGANRYFQDYALIAAHRFAATKIAFEDRYVTMYASGDLNEPPLKVHLWLEDKFRFDLGNYTLEMVHTPGHTSGSICIYEINRQVLFTGDTVFGRGTLSYIGESGSVGDYINSIGRLGTMKINHIYPGHGSISQDPEDDMQQAIHNAKALLKDEEGVEVIHVEEASL